MPKYLLAPEHKNTAVKVAMGDALTVSAADTIDTGLKTVLGCVASAGEDLADALNAVSAKKSATAGRIVVSTWKTDGTDPTPAAATVFGKKVHWIAWGR